MTGTPKTLSGPAFISNAAANVFSQSDSAVISAIRQIHLANVTNASASVSLYRGATNASAAGTELCKNLSIPAYEVRPLFFDDLVMKSTDFLTGVASATNTVAATVIGHQFVTP